MKVQRHKVSTTVHLRMNPSAPLWVFRASSKFLYLIGAIALALTPFALIATRYADALSHFLFGWLAVSLAWFWGLVEQRHRRSFNIDVTLEGES